ncbi:MAG: hypothetical protein LBJ61_06860 [Deltaproteobacteria bacterium]|jgi:hypothetical protein|nr:hypothetical protein [Deltaproteobacteria bacterium]
MASKSRLSLYAIGILALILVLAFVFLPGFLLKRTFNQEFEDPNSILASVKTESLSASLLLDTVTLTNVVLTPSQGQTAPVNVAEAKFTGLNGWKVLKAIFGGQGDDFDLLSEALVVLRGVELPDGPEVFLRFRIGTLSLDGYRQAGEILDPSRFDQFSFKSLKFTDFSFNVGNNIITFSCEGLSFFDLKNSGLGGLAVAGLEVLSPNNDQITALSLADAAVSNLDMIAFGANFDQLFKKQSIINLYLALSRLRQSFGGLDLSTLSVAAPNGEMLFLRRALMDDLDDGGQSTAGRLASVEGLTLDLPELSPYLPDNPLALAVIESLDPKTTVNFKSTSHIRDGKLESRLDLGVEGKIELAGDFSINNPPEKLDAIAVALNADKISVGRGGLTLTDRSFLTALSQAMSRRLYGGTPTAEYLSPYLPSLLSALVDPKPAARPLNIGILEIELNEFLRNPQKLELKIDPVPGYPMAVFEPGDFNLPQLVLGGPQASAALAEKYKYAMLSELNLTLEINGRAPVAVYLNNTGPPLPAQPVGPTDEYVPQN